MLTGKQLISGQWLKGDNGTFKAINPKLAQAVEPSFSFASRQQITDAIDAASDAFKSYAKTSLETRAKFLEYCAEEIIALGDDLIERAILETGYDQARILTERKRTCDQLFLYAELLRKGDCLNIRINTAIPNRKPVPRPDLRFINQAIGPVVVFGASNFPLAYSVAGGDTVSALAAGCPVVFKGHNSHPGTCELVASAIAKAVKKSGLASGVFSMLLGDGNEIGKQLVSAKKIKAVGFTGSTQGGTALLAIANQRAEPIPVFAEMGSINPVVFLPESLEQGASELAALYVNSLTAGTGQFCVSPGIILLLENQHSQSFEQALKSELQNRPANVMLNQTIFNSFQQGIKAREQSDKLASLASGQQVTLEEKSGLYTRAHIHKTSAQIFIESPELHEELFGHAALVVSCKNEDELLSAIRSLPGQLTGSIHGTEKELAAHQNIIDSLQEKSGRLVFNGFPTGVEVCEAMVHGGPFPASTDVRFTSVGTAAIARFVRPVCYQNCPQALLPDALKNKNQLQLNRIINGDLTTADI